MSSLDDILSELDTDERRPLTNGTDIWAQPPTVEQITRHSHRKTWYRQREIHGVEIQCERPECENMILLHPCQVGRTFACSDYCRKEMWNRRNRSRTTAKRPVWRPRKVNS